MDSLQKDLANAQYFYILSDSSTDSRVIEEKLVYLLFLKSGKLLLKFLSVEPANNTNAEGIIECIKTAFEQIGILDFQKRIMGLNVDGASVNTGVHNGVGVLMHVDSPWLQVIHCFNHHLELAIKDAFKNDNFNKIDEMLMKFYYFYQKSPKLLQELKHIAEAWEKSVPKPSKSYGTRWIDHKLTSMKIMLENYGAYISHVESLSQTDSQALKRAELKGYLLKWKDASIPISLAIYLDVLSPLKRLSLSFQKELHDSVKAVRRIQDFNLTMVKLKLLVDESLENPDSIMTNLKKLFQDVEKKDDSYFYQGIKLARYEAAKRSVSNHYEFTIASITDSMQNRFEELSSSPLFKNLVSLLDVSS